MTSITRTSFLRDIAILFFGVLIATTVIGPIKASSPLTLVIVALVLAVLNVVLKPILILFALPFVVFTFGFGIILINALLLLLADWLVGDAFIVPGFGIALLGAIIISLCSMAVNVFLSPRPNIHVRRHASSSIGRSSPQAPRRRKRPPHDDVIDV